MVVDENQGGRFSSFERHIVDEGTLHLTSVGVDIGSSTSHLIFSRLTLELENNRYVVTGREVISQSDILLTPYTSDQTIDGDALGRFIDNQYEIAGVDREDVDTGALILTGVALLRENARAIAELFAEEAGKFVSVSAGDNLEAIMAAYGSGAMAITDSGEKAVMNVDMGGGTTKIVVCANGKAQTVCAIDVGARLIATDKEGKIVRLEEQGRRFGEAVGLNLALGQKITPDELTKVAAYMADRLMEHISLAPLSPEANKLLRTPRMEFKDRIDAYTFSGGVSEFIYNREPGDFGDIGPYLARETRKRVEATGSPIIEPAAGIRATVIGASQYSVQVSGSTIFIAPSSAVPVRNIPVISPVFDLHDDDPVDQDATAKSVTEMLNRFDLQNGDKPVAIAMRWRGGATFDRIDDFCHGVIKGMQPILDKGHPLVLVYDGDIGGLIGIHLQEEVHLKNPIISIDGIELKEFDFIDVGSLIPSSGAVPVVIKSLIFSATNLQ